MLTQNSLRNIGMRGLPCRSSSLRRVKGHKNMSLGTNFWSSLEPTGTLFAVRTDVYGRSEVDPQVFATRIRERAAPVGVWHVAARRAFDRPWPGLFVRDGRRA